MKRKEWSQHPHSTHEWQALVQHLREAPPVPWQQLHNTLSVLQQVHVQNGGQLSTIEADLPHSSHPAAPGNRDPLPLGLEPHDGHQRIRSSNSTGSTAEHLGERLAARAAVLADRWRQPTPPATTAQQNAGTPRPDLTQTHRAAPARANNSGEEGGTRAGAPNVEDSPSSSSTTTDSSSSTSATSGSPRPNVDTPAQEAATTSQTGPPSNPQRSPAPPNNNEAAMRRALRTLDQINLLDTLRQRVATFATPPQFIRGRVRTALHFSLEQIQAARTEQEQTRARTGSNKWKRKIETEERRRRRRNE